MHMSAIVDEASASVTFLYKLVEGCRFKHAPFAAHRHSFLTQRPIVRPPLRRSCWPSSFSHIRRGHSPIASLSSRSIPLVTCFCLFAGARNRLEQLQHGTGSQSMADATLLLRRLFEEKDAGQLLQVSGDALRVVVCDGGCLWRASTADSCVQLQQRVRALSALGTGSYGRDLLV